MTYARRVDRNHGTVAHVLKQAGWAVVDTSRCAGLWDLVCVRRGICMFVEVKDGSKPASARKLTPAQQELHALFAGAGYPIRVVTSIDEALTL